MITRVVPALVLLWMLGAATPAAVAAPPLPTPTAGTLHLPRIEQRQWRPPLPATAEPSPTPEAIPVCRVTVLADRGPATLRWCVDQGGPRRVAIRVSGTVRHRALVNVGSDIEISGAGQRVALEGYGLMVRHAKRVRLSHLFMRDCKADCITVSRSDDVLIEWLDATLSGDGLLDIIRAPAGGGHVTVRDSRFYNHAKCMLVGHQSVPTDRNLVVVLERVTFDGCQDRMPTAQWATITVRDSTIANWRQEGAEARHYGRIIFDGVTWIRGRKSHERYVAYAGGSILDLDQMRESPTWYE